MDERWEYLAVIEKSEREVNELGSDGWELVGVTDVRSVTIYDEDVPPTWDSPGVPVGMEKRITGVLKRAIIPDCDDPEA